MTKPEGIKALSFRLLSNIFTTKLTRSLRFVDAVLDTTFMRKMEIKRV